jgi:rhamnosyltransferase
MGNKANDDEPERAPLISIVILTKNAGSPFPEVLESIFSQTLIASAEVLLIDSGSTDETLEIARRFPVRIHSILPEEFNFGLTRDLGYSLARGEILVNLSQDVVPISPTWLEELTLPFQDPAVAAVSARCRYRDDSTGGFLWQRMGWFYFTRDMKKIRKRFGTAFSNANSAVRKKVWEENRIGEIPIAEDILFQKKILDKGHEIRFLEKPLAYHEHGFSVSSLAKRCINEGLGFKRIGISYTILDFLLDFASPRKYLLLVEKTVDGKIRSWSEFFFPFLRPVCVFWGNHFRKRYLK